VTFFNVSAVALEKPTVQSISLSKMDIDITDPNVTIDFEVLITHPKGIEDVSTQLFFTNSGSVNISVTLVRTDSPVDFSKKEVLFKGKLALPRTLNSGVYTYSIDGVQNNFDSGTRFPTGIVNGPTLRTLKGAESGIIIRSNGELSLDYETINGPACGSQSGLAYLDAKKYTSVAAPIWRVGETLNLIDYFEVTVPEVELMALTFTPNICTSDGKIIDFISEGECQYKVFTPKTKNYIEKSKLLSATITNARSQQNLTVENIQPLKPSSLPLSLLLSPVYASGLSAVEYVIPKSSTPSTCETGGYVLKIVSTGICELTYKSAGNDKFLPSKTFVQSIQILADNLPTTSVQPVTPSPSPTPVAKTETTKSIMCTKGKITKKVSGTNPKCPKGYKLKK
jgi:hypothetical protein